MKITKAKFIEYAKANALKAGYRSNLLDSDVVPCDCKEADCQGWQIPISPSMYLTPNITIKYSKLVSKGQIVVSGGGGGNV